MSTRFNRRPAFCVLVAAIVAVGGCGRSGTRPPPETASLESVPAAEAEGEPGESVLAGVVDPIEVPESAMAAYALALDAMANADWTEAELGLEQVVLEHPGLAGPYVNLAIIYRRAGREADAEAALAQALALSPGHPAANNERGILERQKGQFEEAEEAYRRALESDPDYALVHYNLGVLLDVYLQRPGEALEHYERYQTLLSEPDDEVGRWITDLRRRLGLPEETEQIAQETGP